jgi:ABC-type transporter Mla MlaB component
MSIRVTCSSEAGQTVLRIAGQLKAEAVAELARHCEAAARPDVIDLSDLQTADPEGVRLLLDLFLMGAEIRGASPYIELLLQRGR